MSLIYTIIYAANARGTHHKLALDALQQLTCKDAGAWQRLFLKHAALFVHGAKAPDDEFKDFQNHVLHVRDGYWGGAADKVENWYGHLVGALREERWSEAVWAAGVLSHYYADPIHPFHTAQSDAETNIHAAVEWSISRSYDDLARQARTDAGAAIPLPVDGTGPGWLRDFVVQGAETSNKSYELLLAHYDINQGVVDPPAGLDPVARRAVAGLIGYATTGIAILLDRAIVESKAAAPAVNLALDAVLAAIKIPIRQLLARIEDAGERRKIEAIYDELKATGRVEHTLTEDERVVAAAYKRDVLDPKAAMTSASRAGVVALPPEKQRAKVRAIDVGTAVPPAAPAGGATPKQMAGAAAPPRPAATIPDASPLASPAPAPMPAPAQAAIVAPSVLSERRDKQPPRVYLTPGDDVERAPSIGPKTAERLYGIGIKTVSDLLAANPEMIAEKLDVRHVDEDTVVDWMDQSRLVMSVPGLRGTHAQLLVGAGFRDASSLAAAAPDDLLVAVLKFARTSDGERILRDGNPPDLEKVAAWIAHAATRAA